jgi:membrane fusion protein, copper/silver efflux system
VRELRSLIHGLFDWLRGHPKAIGGLAAAVALTVFLTGLGQNEDHNPATSSTEKHSSSLQPETAVGHSDHDNLQDAPAHRHDQAGHVHAHPAGGLTEAAGQKKYVCPMNCVPPMEKPGRCPVCGMDLMAMGDGTTSYAEKASRIALSPTAVYAAGIQVAPVEEKFVSAEVRLFGRIEYDPIDQYQVSAFAPGVIDNVFVKRAGQEVRRGDPLFELHSAELFFLEQELFALLSKLPYETDLRPGKGHSPLRTGRWTRLVLPKKQGTEGSLSAADEQALTVQLEGIKRKMSLLGLSDEHLEEAIVRGRPTGISTVVTPMTGIVLKQNAFKGTFVNTGDVVFTIANPRVLWARLDAYASDFPWIRFGQEAEFETDAYPGQKFKGKVTFIDPEFSSDTRVFKVGVLYRDDKGLLKPNMLIRAVIQARMTGGGRGTTELVTQGMMGTAQTKRLDQPPKVIPETAPLITGTRAVVYVAAPGKPGVFEGRGVKLGPRAQGYYVVLEGLEKGELVVVNGNFKIDSAVQILARSSMLSHGPSEVVFDDYRGVQTPETEAASAATATPPRPSRFRPHSGHEDPPKP